MKKFGVREICDVVLRAKAKMTLGSRTFFKNEPVLYFDSLKTSSLEGAATTVYAQGGKGNPRLIAWEGEKTLTFNMEDALLSAESFAILSGANLIEASAVKPLYVHTTTQIAVDKANELVIPGIVCWTGKATGEVYTKANGVTAENFEGNTYYTFADGSYSEAMSFEAGKTYFIKETAEDYKHLAADVFCMKLSDSGDVAAEPCVPESIVYGQNKAGENITTITCCAADTVGSVVLVDYYVKRTGNVKQIEITADKFAGNYYLEGSTLFRRESDGIDMPAEFIIPNGKIQSNFTFSMASTGDPSTFSFVMDAFPDYTKFDRTKKVLAAIQIIEDEEGTEDEMRAPCVVGG